MGRLTANDPNAVESAVTFLEADPFFYRSGYIKEDLLERLRWAPLSPDQKYRLQRVIHSRIHDDRTKREFRRYCRLAPFVADSRFESEITSLAGSPETNSQRAQWVLEHLRQGIPKQKISKWYAFLKLGNHASVTLDVSNHSAYQNC